jgi:NAD(P)-dependent dehydrogenase (short-subunit alcohol dehydrogenase family)
MRDFIRLENKKILITGASSGIGAQLAIQCSQLGAKVVIIGRDNERLCSIYDKLEGSGHVKFEFDLSQLELIDKLVEQLPEIHGCVFNAGINRLKPIQFIKSSDLNEIFAINTFSPILLLKALLKSKKIKNNSSIVFTSSIAGYNCSAIGAGLYSASKSALNGFVKAAAIELAPKNIRVNSVNPALVETNIFYDSIVTSNKLIDEASKYPLKRLGKPEDIANSIIFLLSDASSWITGTNLLIDGGLNLL